MVNWPEFPSSEAVLCRVRNKNISFDYLTFGRGIHVMAITSTMKHPSNSFVSNIRGQPLVIWELIHAAIFGFDSDLQVKLFGGNGNVAYEHDMVVK